MLNLGPPTRLAAKLLISAHDDSGKKKKQNILFQ
jgi:hypothetical protein